MKPKILQKNKDGTVIIQKGMNIIKTPITPEIQEIIQEKQNPQKQEKPTEQKTKKTTKPKKKTTKNKTKK